MSEQWISVKDRLPSAGEMIWRFIPGRDLDCVRLADPRDWLARWQPNWTHWMPAQIPTPPPSEAETAFDEWAKVHPVPGYGGSCTFAKTCFLAGFDAARKGGAL